MSRNNLEIVKDYVEFCIEDIEKQYETLNSALNKNRAMFNSLELILKRIDEEMEGKENGRNQ